MKNLKTIGFSLFVWCFSAVIFFVVAFAVENLLYPALISEFPGFLPDYSFVNEREKYEQLHRILKMISAVIAAIFISYLSVRYDNERFEYMITKTEGMYTLRDGIALWYPRYVRSDLLVAVIIPLLAVILESRVIPLLTFLPESAKDLLYLPLSLSSAFVALFGEVWSIVILFLVIYASRLLAGLRALDRFRVVWLSDIQYLG